MTGNGLESIDKLARSTVQRLIESDTRIALAESCTGGSLAAAMTAVPGASRVLCGSAVTYREATKSEWLDVSRQALAEFTAVSQQVSDEMALGVLRRTPEAMRSLAVTGHYGPHAPPELDGIVYVSIATRIADAVTIAHRQRLELSASTRPDRNQETLLRIFHIIRALPQLF